MSNSEIYTRCFSGTQEPN